MVEKTAEAATPAGVAALHAKENEIVRKTFCKNEDLLRAMSNIMLGVCKNPAEKGLLKATFADPEVFQIVKKRFLPSLDDAVMLAQAKDSWSGIDIDIAGRSAEQVAQFVGYKALLIEMTEQAVELFRNPDGVGVDLSITPDLLKSDPMGTRILARSQYVKNVNQQVSYLWIMGNQEVKEKPVVPGKNKPNPSGKPGSK